MPYDLITPRGQFKGAKPDAGGAVLQTMPVLGIVKDNADFGRTGKIRVLIISENTNVDPNNQNAWRTVNYMSPFFGLTEGSSKTTGLGSYTESPNSYGMWTPAPDIGTLVVCIFIEGRPDFGFYIGCVPKAEALSMLPGISASDSVTLNEAEANAYGGAKRLPTVNINPRNPNSNAQNYHSQPRPVHSYQAAILHQQGLLRDELRGTIGSNAQRETPSRVFGISSPGRPVYEGGYTDENIAAAASKPNPGTKIIARRGGHTFIMDDGDVNGKDNLVRLRTSNGHTILMSDDGQTLFIIHSNGHSWIELGKEGTVDVYATNSINLRTMGDLNLHADNDVNIHAGNALNMYGREVAIQSDTTMTQRVGTDYSASSGGKWGINVGGDGSFFAGGTVGIKGAKVFVEGQPINLNTGSSPYVPSAVKALTITQHPDAVWSTEKGWISTPFKLPSITSRVPSHQPWPLAGLGVGVEVQMTESTALPAAPTTAVQSGNNAAQTAGTAPPVRQSAPATVPNSNPVAASQAATQAAVKNPPPEAVGVGKVTPQQAETSGYIKAGTAQTVTKLITEGKTVPDNVMTGKDGIKSWSEFTKSPTAQANAISGSVQASAKSLATAGVITGKEDPKTVAGVTLAGAVTGVNAVTNFLKTAQTTLSPDGRQLGAAVSSATSAITKVADLVKGGNQTAISAGGLSGLMTSVGSKLTGISSSLAGGVTKTFEAIKGTVTGVFNSIKNSLPKLKAGEPQNIREIANKAEQEAQKPTTGNTGGILGAVTGGINTVVGGLGKGITTVVGGIGSVASGAVKTISGVFSGNASQQSATTGTITKVATDVASSADVQKTTQTAASNATSSALSGLPGGINAITTIVNMKNPSSELLAGAVGLLNKLKGSSESLLSLAKTGVPASAQNQIQSQIAAVNTNDQSVKLPEAASDTNDAVTAVRASFGGLVGSKVPLPPSGAPIQGYNPALVSGDPTVPSAPDQAPTIPQVTYDNRKDELLAKLQEYKKEYDELGTQRTTQRMFYNLPIQKRISAGIATPDEVKALAENEEAINRWSQRRKEISEQASLVKRELRDLGVTPPSNLTFD